MHLVKKNETAEIESLGKTRSEGRIGYILLWLLGVPIPILLILFLLRGCT
jgi:hypothetical protein